jgi:hypothetical protein
MRFLIHISALQKGFLMTLGNILSDKKNHVSYLCRDKSISSLIETKIQKKNYDKIYIEENINDEINNNYELKRNKYIIKDAKKYEKKYNINFSFILGKDRALGRGYLLNVDRYPHIQRANWEKEKKLMYLLNILKNIEKVVIHNKPKIILSVARSYFISLISKKYNIKYFTLASSRLGNRFYWSDNDYNTNSNLISDLKKAKNKKSQYKYSQIVESKKLHANIRYGITNIFIDVVREILKEIKQILKNNRRKYSYNILGWVPVRIRKYFAYRFVKKNSKELIFFKKRKFIYIPLHLEPEIALMGLSPEFNNSLEMITWVSKNIPADFSIIIKEQPFAYGTRSLWFYKTLLQMPNVYLANPKIHPWDWIKNCFCVSTITGTAAYEAVHFKKPVISFGANQVVNLLPTVKYCRSFFDVKSFIEILIKNYPSKKNLNRTKNNLINSLYKNSFELKDYLNTYYSSDTDNKSSFIAANYIKELNT